MKRNTQVLLPLFLLTLLVSCQAKKSPVTPVSLPKPVRDLAVIYFDYDRSNIRDDQADALISNGDFFRENPNMTVTVEGHCDDRGTNEYNLALGDQRAQSAKNYLINLGIDPNRMNTVSYGEERPVATCQDESCWWQNRRGVFVK